ncbi:hypothetical protein [Spartinivicinus poritis]|uniref:Uncharacterized protein n=1 Tax=Spartinivicinus poritis TaxID=2994640 RepID=A0ABT5UHA3_9GAMM|nr:hypothetical protein [Spartinivicinus sp. A2-2]MDE1465776.1 hypothetical protein [Spartinivicinus sp. A2-2]
MKRWFLLKECNFKKSLSTITVFSLLLASQYTVSQTVNLDIKNENNIEISDNEFIHNTPEGVTTWLKNKLAHQLLGTSIKLINNKSSLLATHYTYAQVINDIPIEGSYVIISVDNQTRNAIKGYKKLININKYNYQPESASGISSEEVINKAVKHFDIKQKQLKITKPELTIFLHKNNLILVYKLLVLNNKSGESWSTYIRQRDGVILKTIKVPSNGRYLDTTDLENPYKAGVLIPTETTVTNEKAELTNGRAKIFKFDPPTKLKNSNINHNSPEVKNAYSVVTLPSITKINNLYYLKNKWVEITKLSPLKGLKPTSSLTGDWLYERDSKAFVEANAFYHIDQSQRYLQSLGYIGNKGIQNRPIKVDTHAEVGNNAGYSAADNAIRFGIQPKTGINFAESPQVIIHEYGHAILSDAVSHVKRLAPTSMPSDWGAIHEGFSDFWAASYYLKANKNVYKLLSPFKWMKINRDFRKLHIQYDRSKRYNAHQRINGDFYSEELWATPLVNSLKSLVEKGIPVEEVDKVVIEGHMGLGYYTSLRQAAQSIVKTANLLYPEGPHAKVFQENFIRHNILEIQPDIKSTLIIKYPIENINVILPGDEIELYISLRNTTDNKVAENIYGYAQVSNNATFINNQAMYGSISPKELKDHSLPIKLKISESVECGEKVIVEFNYKGTVDGIQFNKKQYFPLLIGANENSSINCRNYNSKPKLEAVKNEVTVTADSTLSDVELSVKGFDADNDHLSYKWYEIKEDGFRSLVFESDDSKLGTKKSTFNTYIPYREVEGEIRSIEKYYEVIAIDSFNARSTPVKIKLVIKPVPKSPILEPFETAYYSSNDLLVVHAKLKQRNTNNGLISYKWELIESSGLSIEYDPISSDDRKFFKVKSDKTIGSNIKLIFEITATDSKGNKSKPERAVVIINSSKKSKCKQQSSRNDELQSCNSKKNLTSNDMLPYYIYVPHDAEKLTIKLKEGIGNADLYVSHSNNGWPNQTKFDFKSANPVNNEEIIIQNPIKGSYYHVVASAKKPFSGVELKAKFN